VLLSDSTGSSEQALKKAVESTADDLTSSNTNGTHDPASNLKHGCKIS